MNTTDLQTATATYRVSWEGYSSEPKPQVVGLQFFADNDFEPDACQEIESLPVGGEWVDGGPFDSCTVERLS